MSNATNAAKAMNAANTAGSGTGRPSGPRRGRLGGQWRALGLAAVALGGAGCSLDNLLKSDELPPGVRDPAVAQTPEGALQAYRGALGLLQLAFAGGEVSVVSDGGLLSDELQTGGSLGASVGNLGPLDVLNKRSIAEDYDDGAFGNLQKMRGQGGQAIALLTRHVPEQPALAAHLYALVGYSEVFLADLFCSGIPLSTLDFNGDYTLQPGSATAEVFQHAAALFDSASELAGDSTRFRSLAAVGKGRALLGRGEFAAAAAAVAGVPDDYRYNVSYVNVVAADTSVHPRNFMNNLSIPWDFSVADQEGENGLDYIASGDPRTAATLEGMNSYGYPVYRPAKYASDGSGPIVLASGVEARLIEAEAALQGSDLAGWLAKLNALRTDGTFETTATPPPDTLWHQGTGLVDGLAPLEDPGAALADPAAAQRARVDLLFRERAFWLFLTGHRQGDLRRLIRQYGRFQQNLYPVGSYPGGSGYGSEVTLPVPAQEQVTNPLFTGCLSHGA